MPDRTLADLSDKMRRIDVAMLSTRGEDGAVAGRPMSNNGEVEYDGTSRYFTWEGARMVSDIARDPGVALAFQGEDAFHVAVAGRAEVVRDKAAFAEHWTPGLERWFPQGVDTPGLVMIAVAATRVHYWDGEENGEVPVRPAVSSR